MMTEAVSPAAPCVAWHCGDKDECHREEGNCCYPSHFYLTTTRMVDPRRTGVKRRLVPVGFETGQRNQVGFCVHGRHPPLKHHPTRARHGEQVAVPGGLGCVAGQRAVRAVVVDEVFKVGEEGHSITLRGSHCPEPVIFQGGVWHVLSLLLSHSLSFWRWTRLWVIGGKHTHPRIFDSFPPGTCS